jgi:hypothetical protein
MYFILQTTSAFVRRDSMAKIVKLHLSVASEILACTMENAETSDLA